nr:type I-C CRISPR-associated protein Cas8c/Csd1 [Neisseria iguanae]
MSVPHPEKRTSGVKPNFLWDKIAYLLGVEGNKDKQAAKETLFFLSEKTFAAFRQHHLDLLQNNVDAGLRAFCSFLEKRQPENFTQPPRGSKIPDANMVLYGVHTGWRTRPSASERSRISIAGGTIGRRQYRARLMCW